MPSALEATGVTICSHEDQPLRHTNGTPVDCGINVHVAWPVHRLGRAHAPQEWCDSAIQAQHSSWWWCHGYGARDDEMVMTKMMMMIVVVVVVVVVIVVVAVAAAAAVVVVVAVFLFVCHCACVCGCGYCCS